VLSDRVKAGLYHSIASYPKMTDTLSLTAVTVTVLLVRTKLICYKYCLV